MYTILVADDDPDVLEALATTLRSTGHVVLPAHDGYEAIRILADRHVDLMIADVQMPGLDGTQLGVQAKVMRPQLRVLYITGFDRRGKELGGAQVLQKPVRASRLIEIVEQVMSRA